MCSELGPIEEDVEFRSADGILVKGTYLTARNTEPGIVLLVHGLTENRNEAFGFYDQLARLLAIGGFSSLRFDLRGHGESDQSYADLTLFNALSDIDAATDFGTARSAWHRVHLVGTSFGGGLAAIYAALHGSRLGSIVLLCPNLDYRRNWLEAKPYWSIDGLTAEGAKLLKHAGALPHGEFKIGRWMFHELIHVRPFQWMSAIQAPSLTIHGTADSVVPHDLSAQYYKCNAQSELLLLEGADHGFAAPGDEDFSSPATRANLDQVFTRVVSWLQAHSERGEIRHGKTPTGARNRDIHLSGR